LPIPSPAMFNVKEVARVLRRSTATIYALCAPTPPMNPSPSSARPKEGEVLVAGWYGLHLAKPSFLQERRQLGNGALAASTAENREQVIERRMDLDGEVQRQEATAGLEHAPDLGSTCALQRARHMVEHHRARHQVEGGVWKGKRLDSAHPEIDASARLRRLLPGDGDHFRRWVDPEDLAGSHPRLEREGERAWTAADVERVLSRQRRRQFEELVPVLAPEGEQRAEQVVPARPVDNARALRGLLGTLLHLDSLSHRMRSRKKADSRRAHRCP